MNYLDCPPIEGSYIVAQQRKVISTTREQAARLDRGPDKWMTWQQDERPKVTLKDGVQLDARWTLILLQRLRTMMDVHPRRFQSLSNLAHGTAGDAAPDDLEQLKDAGFLDSMGTVRPDVKSVLCNAYRETPEGPVLTSPVRLASKDDAAKYEHVNADLDQKLRDLLRSPDDNGPSLV